MFYKADKNNNRTDISIEDVRKYSEEQLKDLMVGFPRSTEELLSIMSVLIDREHDYGSAVYAISLSTLAAFNYASGKLGITGFQASCTDLDFLRRNRRLDNGFCIINYNDLLYPQYRHKFKTYEQLLEDNKQRLGEAAIERLKETPNAHPEVISHWKMLASKVDAALYTEGVLMTEEAIYVEIVDEDTSSIDNHDGLIKQ